MIEMDSLDERLDGIAIRLAKIIQELTEIAPAAGIAQLLSNL